MRATASDWDRLLDHLAFAGPSSLEDLRFELDLKPKELKGVGRRSSVAGRSSLVRFR